MDYIERLIANCISAKKALPTSEFEYKNLEDLSTVKNAIYIIEDPTGNIEKTFNDFKAFKLKTKRKCSRLNRPCKIMYVGSSTTNLKKRIKEHLGDGHPSTYSLHMKHWFKQDPRITIRVYDVEREVLQIIEDALSDELNPAFGKQ